MPRQLFGYSIPTKFNLKTLTQLRQEAEKNERSLSGEIRYRVNQSLKSKDSPDERQAQQENKSQVHR